MKYFLGFIWIVLIIVGCGSSQELVKGNDPAVDLVADSTMQQTPSKATHKRPMDIPQLMEVLEFTDMEIVEFKSIYKSHAKQLMLVINSDRDARSKVIEEKKIIESRDRLVLKMLDSRQRNIYLEFLNDLAMRDKENSKDGQNDKM